MAVSIKFDSANKPEIPTLILSKKNGDHIGVLNTASEIYFNANLNSYDELSFVVYKNLNGKKNKYWDEIVDFRLIYIPEWKKRFEIHVELNEADTNTKSITAVSLCEEELSHLYAHGVEINTEKDIERKDYSPSVLYDTKNPKTSILDRIIADEASHYRIVHVDNSIKNIQRTFSFDGTSIYDAFMEIAEEIHCLFVFGEETEDGYFRTISVYDLESYCPSCNYRDEFTEKCPKCGSKNITEGYGVDTTIFLSQENLTEEINYSMTTEPYIYEGTPIPYFTTNESRICTYDGGNSHSYWLRSPNIAYSTYFYRVEDTGILSGYYYSYNEDGVRIMFSI